MLITFGTVENHEKYMHRCLQLAALGLGKTSPNPLVGSVIVHDEKIIGEGYHQEYGQAHAEVNAIANVNDKALLTTSTLYVNLEPCAHFGKTPPCADLIISMKIPRVVICNKDPFPEVAGKGIQKLIDAGVEVITGVLEKEGRHLNRRFFTSIEKQRPFVILKWAKSRDAFMDIDRGAGQKGSHQITGLPAQRLVHQWRSNEDAILVGLNTVKTDNPALTTRLVDGKNPIRIVIDPRGELTSEYKVFDSNARLIIFSDIKNKTTDNSIAQRVFIDLTIDPVGEMLNYLHQEKIRSLIVEGGRFTLSQYLSSDMWDEIRLFTGKDSILFGMPSPTLTIKPTQTQNVGEDILDIYLREL